MDHLPGDALGRVYIYPFYVTEIRMVTGAGGISKYAFVRFPSIAERTRALYIMQGVLCLGRPSKYLIPLDQHQCLCILRSPSVSCSCQGSHP